MVAVERARRAARIDPVAVADAGAVVARGQRQVPGAAERQRVGGERAPRADRAVEADARVRVQHAGAGHRAIRVEAAQLRRLREPDAAAVVGAAGGELMMHAPRRAEPRQLSRCAAVVLRRVGPVEQAVVGPGGLVERRLVDVGVERAGGHAAVVEIARQRQRRADAPLGRDVEEGGAVAGLVGRGIDAGVVALEKALLLQAVAGQRVVGVREGDLEIALHVVPAGVAQQLAHGGGRVTAPAVLAEQVARDVPVQPRGLRPAMLELERAPRGAAQHGLDAGTGIAAPVLGVDRERAAERVQPEQRVRAGHQRDRRHGDARDQIPAHHVPERLVQPDAVHVDRQPLRRAEQRRRGVAAVVDVGLERVALHLVDVHTGEASVQEVGEVERAARRDVAPDRGLNRRRNVGEPQIDARQRRRPDHLDLEHQRFRRRRMLGRLRGGDDCLRRDARRGDRRQQGEARRHVTHDGMIGA